MSEELRLRIDPKESIDTQEAESLQVRITYQTPGKAEEEQSIGHPASETVRLDRHARAETTIQPIAVNRPINAILENRQGLEISDLGTISPDTESDSSTAKLVITATVLKQALARLTPDEQPVLMRSGRFVRLGQPDQRFDKYTLSVDLIDTPAKHDALKALLQQSEDETLQTNASQLALVPETADQLGALSLTAADLKFDGSFHIKRPFSPGSEAPGWAWMLNGPELIIGYREDSSLRLPQSDLRLILPWSETQKDGAEGSGPDPAKGEKNPPHDVDEDSLLNEPDMFSDDPGSFCKPFSNPARILGERRFHTVFRVEQPEIESTSNTKPDYKGLMHPKDASQPMVLMNAMVAETGAETRNMESDLPRIHNFAGSINRFLPQNGAALIPPVKAIDFLPLPKAAWLNRRQPVGPGNPIDWDGDSTQYQALSVAGGHIMEWRVQWRSNGYSLGDVAHTLTLAPRQTRRIVKMDWRRREESSRRERSGFREEVAQSTFRERDYSDAVRSNMNEWSKGGSKSQTTGAAGGIGFAMGPVVIGGGASHGRASSSSWQKGGRSVAAAEEQSLRDAVRQYGDSLRQFESTVVNEVSQEETVEGVSEVVRNPNYCHSLTVIYHEILRHMRVDTVLAGVRECLFVPFSIRPFTLPRLARWRDVFEDYLKKPELRWALKYADDIANNWNGVDEPPDGSRMSQKLESLSGSIYIKLGIERPRDEVVSEDIDDQLKEEGAVGEKVTTKVWQAYAGILPFPVGQIVARIRDYSAAQRDAYFQREIAPGMARRWCDRLEIESDNGALEGADFTLVGEYRFNRTVRVDFTVPADALEDTSREDITRLIFSAAEDLPKGSVANVTSATVEFHTAHYHRRVRAARGTHDLIAPPAYDDDSSRPAASESATLSFKPTNWEKQNPRDEAEKAIEKVLGHINDNLHYYHKVLWWTMDRDELYMLLDGFAISSSDRRSIASVVEREPIAILGNSLVFKVAAGAFLGINGHESYQEAFDYYKGEGAPATPMRVSLPTDGLYAQAIMDQCEACEEHEGSTDWVLNDEDPALADFPSNFFDSRRSQPQNMTPSQMPDSIINLHNAPAAPGPQGFSDILNTLGSNNAFRDMAGLEGTQENALGAMQSASNLAGQFGNFALQARLADIQAERDAGKNFDRNRAAIDRAVAKGSMSQEDGEQALRSQANEMGRQPSTGLSRESQDLVERFGSDRNVSVTEQTPDGVRSVNVSEPSQLMRYGVADASGGAAPAVPAEERDYEPLSDRFIVADDHAYLRDPEDDFNPILDNADEHVVLPRAEVVLLARDKDIAQVGRVVEAVDPNNASSLGWTKFSNLAQLGHGDEQEFDVIADRVSNRDSESFRDYIDYIAYRNDYFGSLDTYLEKQTLADAEYDQLTRGERQRIGTANDTPESRKILYRWLREAFHRQGISDPLDVIRNGLTQDMRDKLDAIRDAYAPETFSVSQVLVVRPKKKYGRYRLGTLSNHATGTAVDITPQDANPQIRSESWSLIETLAQKTVDRSRARWLREPGKLWDDVKALNDAYKAKLEERVDDGEQLSDILSGHSRLLRAAQIHGGFFNLPRDLVVLFAQQDLIWGVTFSSTPDLHHFEIA
ncbi:M15 family metallopeptidase [Marinobacter sp. GN3S48]|uniref:M15 family metallopeptidase n=1 Tax=Marinobacter sp. GN3S48 TaxID=3382302 RepID=UPI00387B9B13